MTRLWRTLHKCKQLEYLPSSTVWAYLKYPKLQNLHCFLRDAVSQSNKSLHQAPSEIARHNFMCALCPVSLVICHSPWCLWPTNIIHFRDAAKWKKKKSWWKSNGKITYRLQKIVREVASLSDYSSGGYVKRFHPGQNNLSMKCNTLKIVPFKWIPAAP